MSYVGAIFYVICLSAAVLGVRRRKDADLYLLVGILLRFAAVGFYSVTGDSDPDGYGAMARLYANMSPEDLISNFPTGAYFYSWLISFPYRLFGESELMVRSINGLLSCVALFIAYDLVRSLFGNKAARKATLFLAVFPALIRFSGPFASRETLFAFLELMALSLIYRYYSGGGAILLLPTVAVVAMACIVHTSAFMFFVLLLLVVMNNSSADKGMKLLIGTLGIVFVSVGVYLMFSRGIGTEKLYLNNGGLDLDKLNWISESSADGRAAYLKGFTFSNPVLTVLFLPVRVAFFLYAPFIWMVRNMLDVFGFIDGLLYILVSYHSIRHVRAILMKKSAASRNERFVLYVGIMLICMLAMFAIGTSNYGTALRHRAKLIYLFVIICGPFLNWPIHISKGVANA